MAGLVQTTAAALVIGCSTMKDWDGMPDLVQTTAAAAPVIGCSSMKDWDGMPDLVQTTAAALVIGCSTMKDRNFACVPLLECE